MPKHSVVIIMRMFFAVFFMGLLSATLSATPCWGSDRTTADPTITLDVQNEPLRSVLGRISKTTCWTIQVPDKWMDKPITQMLNTVSMEEGLRFILKDAGVENLLLTYDEGRMTITVYDTEIQHGQSANRSPVQGDARSPVLSTSDQPDPVLTRPTKDVKPGRISRTRNRRPADTEED
jgi:hypothetical protein